MTKKVALMIGCNYRGTDCQLNGCLNDVENLKEVLLNKFHYDSNNITVLTDDSIGELYPNRKNILTELDKLIERVNLEQIEEVWFSFSGHGSSIRDRDGDESDGYDECIIPLDYQKDGVITDDMFFRLFGKIKNPSCKLTLFFDCCHSGTMADLPYIYHNHFVPSKEVESNKRIKIKRGRRFQWVNSIVVEKKPSQSIWSEKIEKSKGEFDYTLLSLSGCRDEQTSADFYNNNRKKWEGALTRSFINTINDNSVLDYRNLLGTLHHFMRNNKFTQRPVLSCNKKIDNSQLFYLDKEDSFIG